MGEHWIAFIAGVVILGLGLTGVMNSTPKGSRLAARIGAGPAKLLYIIIGIVTIVLSFIIR